MTRMSSEEDVEGLLSNQKNENLQIICSRKSFMRVKKRKNNLRYKTEDNKEDKTIKFKIIASSSPKIIVNHCRNKRRFKWCLRWRLGAILLAFVGSIVLSAYSVNLSLGHNTVNLEQHKTRYARSAENEGNFTEAEGANSSEICVEPAMNEFPKDGFTDEQRKGGAVIIHILLVSKNPDFFV